MIGIGPDIVRSCLRSWFPNADIKPGKKILELGPGTGQATEPILNTGCDYYAIELGGNLADMMKRKYGKFANFDIVNADFIITRFGDQRLI